MAKKLTEFRKDQQRHAEPNQVLLVAQVRQYGSSTKYHVKVPAGTNSRLDELQAAFLLAPLPLLDGFNQRRRDIIERYRLSAEGGSLRVLPAIGEHHVGHLAVALASNRSEVRAALTALNVQTDVHFPIPDYSQPGFASDLEELATTERASGQIFSPPCFPELSEDELQQVCTEIKPLR